MSGGYLQAFELTDTQNNKMRRKIHQASLDESKQKIDQFYQNHKC